MLNTAIISVQFGMSNFPSTVTIKVYLGLVRHKAKVVGAQVMGAQEWIENDNAEIVCKNCFPNTTIYFDSAWHKATNIGRLEWIGYATHGIVCVTRFPKTESIYFGLV